MARFQVTAWLDAETSVQEVSKVFEGLQRLHRRGEVVLSVRARSGKALWPRVVLLIARDSSGQEREIAVDVSDQRELFDAAALERADIYFKRSFWPDSLRSLSGDLSTKIQPFGLNNPAISLGTSRRVLRARLHAGRSLAGLAVDARQLLALPEPRAFEAGADEPTEPLVLFQTRVWPEHDSATAALNERRAALVRALRTVFGPRFVGGLVPSAVAKERFGDLITELPYDMRSYPRVVRGPLIGVYSRGLHDSVAFKFSEYLAASRCIVAEPPEAKLPQPLVEGTHYLGFDTVEECVSRCERLLRDPSAAEEMRRANAAYYRRQVEPAAHLLRILEQAFSRDRPR
jgi:Glycosyl transferases group 1